jgi:hypothetical protein
MKLHTTLVLLTLVTGGCASSGTPPVRLAPPSPLGLRQAQSRSFENADPKVVLKAAMNVLQDEGYVIQQANAELGLVTGVLQWRSSQENSGLKVLKWVAALPTYGASLLVPSGRTEFSSVEASVNVTPESGGARLRISLFSKIVDKKGAVRSSEPVLDAQLYQSLLARFDKAVFLQKEGL